MPMLIPTAAEMASMSWHARQEIRRRVVRELRLAIPEALPAPMASWAIPEPVVVERICQAEQDELWAERERERAREMEALRDVDPHGRVRLMECVQAIYGRGAA